MFEKVRAYFAAHTTVPEEQILPDSELTGLGLTSLELLMIITDFESAFGVSISDSELEQLHTIGDIVALVEK